MSKRRSIVARTAAGAAVALACAAALSACEPGAEDDPVAATRDFITDGMIDGNGFLACAYLTREQQRAASKRAGGGQCRQAFDTAEFTLGGQHIDTVYEVDHLTADDTLDGNRATVELSRGGDAVEFHLVKADLADFSEQEEFEAPDTEWRIAQGALAFIPPTAEPQRSNTMRRSTSDRTRSRRISAAGDYPVTDNGHVVGLLPFRSVAAVPPRAWSALHVRHRVIPAARALTVDTEDDLSDAVAALLQTPLRRALVAHGSDGVGPLSISDVYRLLELRKSAAGGRGQEAS